MADDAHPPRIVAPSPEKIQRAADLLRAGDLVAFPTETVYGLGADATDGLAVARLYEAKGRPRFNPLISHVPDVAGAEAIAVLGPDARRLAEAFWPGPLTLVLPRRADCPVCELATAGLDTIAVRIPAHPVARALLMATGRPVVAPSANRSGHVSATTAAHVAADLGTTVSLILDGGASELGLESTVLEVVDGVITLLRPGAIAADEIARVAGRMPQRAAPIAARPNAPGRLESHYAPRAGVRLEAREVRANEALLAFGPDAPATTAHTINLSPTGNLREAAAGLFAALRALDATGAAAIAVMPIPETGLGEAINDRLRRAAAPRPSGTH